MFDEIPKISDDKIKGNLKIVTGTCHYNENGWCLDHKGGRHPSNFCTEAHKQADQIETDKTRKKNERLTGAD